PFASPEIRPLCILRNLVRFGCSIFLYSLRALTVATFTARAAGCRSIRCFCHAAVVCLRIMLKDFALEDPDLDANDPVRGRGFRQSIVDVGTKGVQRHAAFTVPFG